jgi:hypothetical protein
MGTQSFTIPYPLQPYAPGTRPILVCTDFWKHSKCSKAAATQDHCTSPRLACHIFLVGLSNTCLQVLQRRYSASVLTILRDMDWLRTRTTDTIINLSTIHVLKS